MSEYIYNKLVRDKIPEIISNNGKKAIIHAIDSNMFEKHLNDKLLEEVHEFLQESSLEEIVDIVEVIYAILDFKNLTFEDLEKVRLNKVEERGAFKDRIFLVKVID